MSQINTNKKEISMDAGEANVKALIFALPTIAVFGLPFFLIWNVNILDGMRVLVFDRILFTLLFFFGGVIVHEFIHGLFWSLYIKNGFRSIKFGIMWKFLTPYCHCKEPLKLKYYRIGAIMPAIILGILPAIGSLFIGSIASLVFGIFFTIAAGGDLLMLWLLRKENRNFLVQDHPDKIGCFIFEESNT